jgi:alpha-ribazole phosphatase/probable phosphoglycerate mutase
MLTIDFLRHGELEGGIKYRGCLNDALTRQGRENMDKVWLQLRSKVHCIFSSPLSRCAKPAQAWAKEADIDICLDKRLQELSYGAWEGLTAAEIEQKFPGMLAAWRADPTHMIPPNGEPMQHFAARVYAFMDDLLQAQEDKHILIVAHSGSIRLMLTYLLAAPIQSTRHLAMPFACWSRACVKQGHASLVFHAKDC